MKIERIILIICGILYLFSGFAKAVDSQWFAALIASYGFSWLGNLSPFISGVEIVLGLCLILNIKPTLTVAVTGILTLLFTVSFAFGFFNKGITDCGCMGPFIKIPFAFTFARNILIMMGCYWVWSTKESTNDPVPAWKQWIVYSVGAASFCLAGTTLGMPFLDKDMVDVGDPVADTYLKDYKAKIEKGRSYVFIFSTGCGHCWNSTENVNSYKKVLATNNVIGITFPNEDTSAYMKEMRPNFEVYKYPSNKLKDIFEIPTFLVLEDGKIERIFKSNKIPCAQMLRLYEEQGVK